MIKKTDEQIIGSVLGSAWNSELAKGEKDTFVKNSVVQGYRLAEQEAEKEIEELKKKVLSDEEYYKILSGYRNDIESLEIQEALSAKEFTEEDMKQAYWNGYDRCVKENKDAEITTFTDWLELYRKGKDK